MADTEYTRIFQLATERALSGFSMLVQRMLQDVDQSLMAALADLRSPDQRALSTARRMLRDGAPVFQKRMDALFKTGLERAMRTMYTDLRADMSSLSASDLSLIDD